jgi:hypothetical protein
MKKFLLGILRLAALVGALGGLDRAINLQSDWKWALVALNVGAMFAVAAIREWSKWQDERMRNREINFRLVIFIAIALATDLVCFFVKWPK